MMTEKKPVILCVLDGWGVSTSDAPAYHKTTPTLTHLLKTCPSTQLQASSLDVGLPEGQMGNSEVGHLNLGAGRVVLQDLPRIDAAIQDKSIENNPDLLALIAKKPKVIHLMGLFSDGGVHSHIKHLIALCEIISAYQIMCHVHGFLDGRDTPPRSAHAYLSLFEDHFKDSPYVKLMSLCGRYYAMDRDNRWDRTEKAYDMLLKAEGVKVADWHQALTESYGQNIDDEFLIPHVSKDFTGMLPDEGLICFNFRADRARQILRALLMHDFTKFERAHPPQAQGMSLALTSYASDLDPLLPSLFPPIEPRNCLGRLLEKAGKTQLRIAETEKYPHVTFFFNGGLEGSYQGEDRILVDSPKVATYDLQPEMSAAEVSEKLCRAVESRKYDFILVNYANADMVGHTGNEEAAKIAMRTIDKVVAALVEATEKAEGTLCITADHGNIELLFDQKTGQKHTAHTLNPVPFVIVGVDKKISLREGRLADVAPTLLSFLKIKQPAEMTGQSLIMEAE